MELIKSKLAYIDCVIWIAPASLLSTKNYHNEIDKWLDFQIPFHFFSVERTFLIPLKNKLLKQVLTMPRTTINGTLSVLEAARKRISFLFDEYDNIQLSFSGGKDSTVLFHLLRHEAQKRNRKFILYFQDQEAEYQATVDFVEWCMNQKEIIPLWYQVPIFMTNAASHEQLFLWAWGENEEWIRKKNPVAIHSINKKYPKRFHKFNLWVGQNLIHEKAYKSLCELQELEFETYEKLEKRLKGVHCAARYARENLVYSIKTLPEKFSTWKEYKDFLLDSIHPDLAKIFRYQWSRDFEFNYTKEQIFEKNKLKREDETIKNWFKNL